MATEPRNPNIPVNIVTRPPEFSLSPQKVLIITQGAGSHASGTILENPQIEELDSLLGADSLANFAIRTFRKFDDTTEVDVLSVLESTGEQATAVITVGGDSTETGNLELIIGDEEFKISVPVANGATKEQVATSIKTALDSINSPFTAAVGSGVSAHIVTITFAVKGLWGNDLYVLSRNSIAGITQTITHFSGGTIATATDLNTAGVLKTAINKRYQTIIFDDHSINESSVRTYLEELLEIKNISMEGSAFYVLRTTNANITAKATVDSFVIGINAERTDGTPNAIYNTIPILKMARFAAIARGLRFTEGSDLSLYNANKTDIEGGLTQVTLPYTNMDLGLGTPLNPMTREDQEAYEQLGFSVDDYYNNKTVLGRLKTLYKTDPDGNSDETYQDQNDVDARYVIKEFFIKELKSEYPQHRLLEGSLGTGISTQDIRAYIDKLYVRLSLYSILDSAYKAEFLKRLIITKAPKGVNLVIVIPIESKVGGLYFFNIQLTL